MFTQLLKTSLPLFVIILFGTTGYCIIEGWNIFDSLYMTIISLTTVGFGEIHPLSQQGKIFTMVVIITGVGGFAFIIRNISIQFLQPFFGTAFRDKKMEQLLKKMQDHYIICGFGRIGRDVCHALMKAGLSVVIIDKHGSDELEESKNHFPVINGDASHEEILIKAGINTAKGLVSAVTSEAENVFITMTARDLKPDLFIISRFEEAATKKKLMRAGADQVINPYQIGSQKISHMILKPTISRILDFAQQRGQFDLNIDELEIHTGHYFIGKSVKECRIRDDHNIIIIAIEKSDRRIITNPGPDYVFKQDDRIVMIANEKEIKSLLKKYKRNRSSIIRPSL
ncbi:MAG: potassium channel protein [Proteobacteria bacterium]|nr:potassium channel protein [Pseudomonadota bacterium]